MKHALFAAVLLAAFAVAGCHKNTGSAEVTDASTGTVVTSPVPATGTPPADSAPAPSMGTPTEAAEAAPAPDAGAAPILRPDRALPTEVTEEVPAGGGRIAKPGWCDKDEDCSKGSVCEKCGSQEGQCVRGCHNSAQCERGEYCNQVQCIRCPCPGICEPRA